MPKIMSSYQFIPERFKKKYFDFYRELYDPTHSVLDMKTKELIALAVSIATGCQGCFKGHVKKAVRHGATREEVGEAIAVAIAINAATIVDRTDIANLEEDLVASLWDREGRSSVDENVDDELTP
ncbi:MAG: carboxymuconolactone decarboxylase family protein [candidate division KSB1 bacterium]|nr:carboxymuconolactone decarboxylase family protein [candidate division KSB1 bacterium]MDQ7064335.1 carboxymuconolactone decarboxylase family protein [candidate division KSB1 bacterium]